MPYHIAVRHRDNGGTSREVYRKQIGAADTIFKWWCCPAYEIGLPFIAQIYHDDQVAEGQFIDCLSEESGTLEGHWERNSGLSAEVIPPNRPFRNHLLEKVRFVRAAIDLAREHTGVIEIWQMPYRICVCRSSNGAPHEIFNKPLGRDDTIFTHWFCLACENDLELLTQIYHDGLVVECQSFYLLSQECDKLQAVWQQMKLDDPFRKHLMKRLAFVREAIALASQHKCVVEIS